MTNRHVQFNTISICLPSNIPCVIMSRLRFSIGSYLATVNAPFIDDKSAFMKLSHGVSLSLRVCPTTITSAPLALSAITRARTIPIISFLFIPKLNIIGSFFLN